MKKQLDLKADKLYRRLLALSYFYGSKCRPFNSESFSPKDAVKYIKKANIKVNESNIFAEGASFYKENIPYITYNPNHPTPKVTLILMHEYFHHSLGHIKNENEENNSKFNAEQEMFADCLSRIAILPLISALDKANLKHKTIPKDMAVAAAYPERFESFTGADELSKVEREEYGIKRAEIYNNIIKQCSKIYFCGDMNCLKCNTGRSFYK